MKKKWISILLAVLMVVSLLPLSALAAEGENSNVNPSTGRAPGPKGDSDVALMVYGEMISDAVVRSDYDIDAFWTALQAGAQDALANGNLQALTEMILAAARYAMANGQSFIDENGDLITSVVNNWVYPLMQNDSMMAFAKKMLVWYTGSEGLNEHQLSILDLLPTHALLTKKMPAGHYIMLETGVPKGYAHTPLFYTIEVNWNTDAPNIYDWCYVNVANVGVIGPYFAEDFYTFLRTNSLAAEADKILNLISDGKTGTLIQDVLSGKNDVTAATLPYAAGIIIGVLFRKWH